MNWTRPDFSLPSEYKRTLIFNTQSDSVDVAYFFNQQWRHYYTDDLISEELILFWVYAPTLADIEKVVKYNEDMAAWKKMRAKLKILRSKNQD